MELKMLKHSGKRPNNCGFQLKKDLIRYIQQETKQNHYPSRRELENKFRFRLCTATKGIKKLYEQAGVEYVQKNSQELKQKKADLLTQIVLKILSKLNLDAVHVSSVHERGVDIVAYDKYNNLIGIELKAHNKYEAIKKRNINQLIRFSKQSYSRIILITTASIIQPNLKIPKEIQILFYEDLVKLLGDSHSESLTFIRNKSVHTETDERRKKRQLILDYVRKRLKQGKTISYKDMEKKLHLHVGSYFKNISDIFIQSDVMIPVKVLKRQAKISKRNKNANTTLRQMAINQILDYARTEIKKGNYPSGIDVGKHFGIAHIWDLINMNELYNILEEPAYLERKSKPLP